MHVGLLLSLGLGSSLSFVADLVRHLGCRSPRDGLDVGTGVRASQHLFLSLELLLLLFSLAFCFCFSLLAGLVEMIRHEAHELRIEKLDDFLGGKEGLAWGAELDVVVSCVANGILSKFLRLRFHEFLPVSFLNEMVDVLGLGGEDNSMELLARFQLQLLNFLLVLGKEGGRVGHVIELDCLCDLEAQGYGKAKAVRASLRA